MDVIYNMGVIYMYTDGACKGNPGPGGFGVISVKNKEVQYKYSESCDNTTNNREELKAILHVFELADKNPNLYYIIMSDSAYCVNIINDWIFKWSNNNWKRSNNQPVENLDLIQSLYKYLIKDFWNCQVMKVRGHSNIINNELADALATNNVNKFNKIINENDIKDIELENL